MKPSRFIVLCLVTALCCTLLLWAGAKWANVQVPSLWVQTLIFYLLLTVITYNLLNPEMPPMAFSSRYLFLLVLRLLAALIFLVVAAFQDRSGLVANAVFNLFNYIVFLSLEVVVLFRGLNSAKKG